MVMGYPGIETKPLRDCTDEEVRWIAAYHGRRETPVKLFDEEWWLRTTLATRAEERNPLAGVGLLPLAGLALSRLSLEAARRSSAVRLLFRLRGRIEDRFYREEPDKEVDGDGFGDQIVWVRRP